MNYEDHIAAAKTFMHAEGLLTESAMGMAAAEVVWGAAIQTMDAISHRTGARHTGSNRTRELVIEHLSNKYGPLNLIQGFEAVGHLHNHFYTGQLSNQELFRYSATGLQFVNLMMELAERKGPEN